MTQVLLIVLFIKLLNKAVEWMAKKKLANIKAITMEMFPKEMKKEMKAESKEYAKKKPDKKTMPWSSQNKTKKC